VGRGRSISLKTAPFDRSYTTFYGSAIVSIAIRAYVVPFSSCLMVKLVPFESLSAVSYSPFIVTMALSCISSEIKPGIGRKS